MSAPPLPATSAEGGCSGEGRHQRRREGDSSGGTPVVRLVKRRVGRKRKRLPGSRGTAMAGGTHRAVEGVWWRSRRRWRAGRGARSMGRGGGLVAVQEAVASRTRRAVYGPWRGFGGGPGGGGGPDAGRGPWVVGGEPFGTSPCREHGSVASAVTSRATNEGPLSMGRQHQLTGHHAP